MALKTMIAELNAARKAYEDRLTSLGDDLQKAIGEFLAPHIPPGFAAHWTQYTPYFNDGEPCTFSVNEFFLSRVPDEEDWEPERWDGDVSPSDMYGEADREVTKTNFRGEPYTYTQRGRPEVEGAPKDQVQALARAWAELPEDMLLRAFDDHVQVVVYPDGTFRRLDYSDHY